MQGAANEEPESRTPLLAAPHSPLDWLGRPALHLGGWKCSSCLIGAFGLGSLSFYGIIYNLVIYLVQIYGLTNAAAAYTVSNLLGTIFLCSFLGALVSDAYVGRLWTTLIFQVPTTLFYGLVNIAVIVISQGSATALARSFFLLSLYLMTITSGPTLPSIITLGADQLSSSEDREKYFRVLTVFISTGQLLAVTVVTYIDNVGMWVWGFGLCTASSIVCLTLIAGGTSWFRQYRASGNPLLRNIQVFVAAWRKRSLSLPMDSSLLYEVQGNLSAIPGQRKLQHTSTLGVFSFLDKAAVPGLKETFNPWHLCTVTQVEELKCLVRALPVGIAVILGSVAIAQVSTLFEEQASLMNMQVATWLVIPPASLNVAAIGSAIFTGIAIMAGGKRLPAWCFGCRRQGPAQKATSLRLLGAALVCCFMAMTIAALVEGYRLAQAQKGVLVSIMWLMPQTVLLGVSDNLIRSGGLDFFYSEVSESMRSVGGSIQLIFVGAGNYVSSILVTLITAITTQGGQVGWIANNLNEGHLDYFYWLLASCLFLGLGTYPLFTRSYNYSSRIDMDGKSIEDAS